MPKNKGLYLRKKNLSKNQRSQRKFLRKKKKNLKNLHQTSLIPIKWRKKGMTLKVYFRCLFLMIRNQSIEISKDLRAKKNLKSQGINPKKIQIKIFKIKKFMKIC